MLSGFGCKRIYRTSAQSAHSTVVIEINALTNYKSCSTVVDFPVDQHWLKYSFVDFVQLKVIGEGGDPDGHDDDEDDHH